MSKKVVVSISDLASLPDLPPLPPLPTLPVPSVPLVPSIPSVPLVPSIPSVPLVPSIPSVPSGIVLPDLAPLKELTNLGTPPQIIKKPTDTHATTVLKPAVLPSLNSGPKTSKFTSKVPSKYTPVAPHSLTVTEILLTPILMNGNTYYPDSVSSYLSINETFTGVKVFNIMGGYRIAVKQTKTDPREYDIAVFTYTSMTRLKITKTIADLVLTRFTTSGKFTYTIQVGGDLMTLVEYKRRERIDYVVINGAERSFMLRAGVHKKVSLEGFSTGVIGYVLDPIVHPNNYTIFISYLTGNYNFVVYSSTNQRVGLTQEILNSIKTAFDNISDFTFSASSDSFTGHIRKVQTLPYTAEQAGVNLNEWDVFMTGNSVPIFFRPPPGMRGAQNERTVVMQIPKEEYKDNFFIAYGTSLGNYVFFDLDDLITKFSEVEEEVFNPDTRSFVMAKRINFNNPQSLRYTFVEKELRQLINFLEEEMMVAQMTSIDEELPALAVRIIRLIQKGLRDSKKYISSLKFEVLAKYLKENPTVTYTVGNQTLVANSSDLAYGFFLKLFEAGQYMRYWKGPPHPYNYAIPSGQNRFAYVDQVEDARAHPTSVALISVNETFDKLPPQLRTIIYRLTTYEVLGITPLAYSEYANYPQVEQIGGMIRLVTDGGYCIGYGNSRFTGTGMYYTEKLGRKIPNYNYNEHKNY